MTIRLKKSELLIGDGRQAQTCYYLQTGELDASFIHRPECALPYFCRDSFRFCQIFLLPYFFVFLSFLVYGRTNLVLQFCGIKFEQNKHMIQIKALVLYTYNCIQRMHQNFISGRVLFPSAQCLDWGVLTPSLVCSFSALKRGRVGNILYFAKGQIRCTCHCLKNMCANMRQHLDQCAPILQQLGE